jgi:hypothetical protein
LPGKQVSISLHAMGKALPRINPLLSYLGDAFHLLNQALATEPSQTVQRARLARSSSMHALGALHAAANTALWSQETKTKGEPTLARKYETLLCSFHPDDVLTDLELVTLHELELVAKILSAPGIAQARDYPHAERADLIEFERTPLKGFSHDVTTWPPEYAGAVLGMVNGFLGNFLRHRCGFDAERTEALFGTHLSSEDFYATKFDRHLLKELAVQQQRLLGNASFLSHMSGSRWKIPAQAFHIALLEDCWSQES